MALPPLPNNEPVRLTQYGHGAGCGCKISPAILETILRSELSAIKDPKLLVGNDTRDDAAVYDMGNGRALISTTDFFTPIVDDAFDFGRVAATNAISDVYAMGGRPLLAVAILGWPVDKLPAELASRVVDGGRKVCQEAGIALAGGHSIDSPEPFFGLAVTGEVKIEHIKRNNTARPGDLLILTKPIGTGVHATALKRGMLMDDLLSAAIEVMCRPNTMGTVMGTMKSVHAMTDVTGFGLAGHLLEICRGSEVHMEIDLDKVPLLAGTKELISSGCYADGALRNWKSYASHITGASGMEQMMVLCDPQTSGGLLISIDPEGVPQMENLFSERSVSYQIIGHATKSQNEYMITVI